MFEPDPDEKWEEMATSARAPLRLAAGLRLRMTAKAARRADHGPPSPAAAPSKPAENSLGVDLRRGVPEAAEPIATAGGGLRTRLSRALDRWAAAEVEAGAKLERFLLPKRWHDVGDGAARESGSQLQLHHRL